MSKQAPALERRLLTMAEVAARLGVSIRKAWRLAASSQDFPKAVKVGSRGTRFDSTEFEQYLRHLRDERR
jgi:predicted DNA-binding transcriptional regulator AlpA